MPTHSVLKNAIRNVCTASDHNLNARCNALCCVINDAGELYESYTNISTSAQHYVLQTLFNTTRLLHLLDTFALLHGITEYEKLITGLIKKTAHENQRLISYFDSISQHICEAVAATRNADALQQKLMGCPGTEKKAYIEKIGLRRCMSCVNTIHDLCRLMPLFPSAHWPYIIAHTKQRNCLTHFSQLVFLLDHFPIEKRFYVLHTLRGTSINRLITDVNSVFVILDMLPPSHPANDDRSNFILLLTHGLISVIELILKEKPEDRLFWVENMLHVMPIVLWSRFLSYTHAWPNENLFFRHGNDLIKVIHGFLPGDKRRAQLVDAMGDQLIRLITNKDQFDNVMQLLQYDLNRAYVIPKNLTALVQQGKLRDTRHVKFDHIAKPRLFTPKRQVKFSHIEQPGLFTPKRQVQQLHVQWRQRAPEK